MLPGDERLGPRHHQRGDVIELERGALDQRGQVLHSPGKYLWRAPLEPACAADEPGDGVDAKPGGGDGRPLRRRRVVRADDQHEWTDPRALPRGHWAHELPQLLRALGGGGTHQDPPPAAPTPSIPSDAGVRAIREGKTHYPANEGILELRAAGAKHLSLLSGGRAVNADHIVVSNGSKQSLFNVCFSLFGPGDVVAIPAPAWVSYPQIVYLCRARPVLVPGDPEWSLKVSVRDLDRVVPGAKGLVLCSPCNPTGAVYTHAEIKAIAQWARDRKVWVVADEIYRRIHYGTGPAPSFLDLPDELLERVVVIYGVSKAYAMTGWRIGLALALGGAGGALAKAMAALQSHTTTGANHPAQVAAAAALGDDRVEQDVGRMVAEFRKRRDLVVSRFRQDLPGVEFVEPLGAFYFFFRVDSFGGIGGTEFCTRLITTTGVALVPGAAFGDDRYVRLSYAAATDQLQKALDRIVGFAKKLAD